MKCSGYATLVCDGSDVQVMTIPRDAFGRPEYDTAMCKPCRAVCESMGFGLRPGRETSLPSLRDRRSAAEVAA